MNYNCCPPTPMPSFGGDLLSNCHDGQLVVGLQGRELSSQEPQFGEVVTWTGTQWTPRALGAAVSFSGDLSGNTSTQKVIGLQGRPVSENTPSDKQVLTWSAATNKWTPVTPVQMPLFMQTVFTTPVVLTNVNPPTSLGAISLPPGKYQVTFNANFRNTGSVPVLPMIWGYGINIGATYTFIDKRTLLANTKIGEESLPIPFFTFFPVLTTTTTIVFCGQQTTALGANIESFNLVITAIKYE